MNLKKVTPVGFNYHLISVFGSQSTGKSTLLNYLFGTRFGVMSEEERRQTTKGIWLSKNKKEDAQGGGKNTAENILVMDVEGTDGRERGEDQDFERKAALFALATSEVLIVNIWEHQVGLYQGANMGLLKTVFEVNLQLFLKDHSVPRSLLFFVIRDHLGQTPLENLRKTLMADLSKIWSSLSKPKGLEKSKIEDYFDFAFVALPHKLLQPEKFETEVGKLGLRFKEGYKDPKKPSLSLEKDTEGIFLPEYQRRIPADGLSHYASGIWDQIVNNKDLDLPTQQELLAQFRCDEISREVLVAFDERMAPFEIKQVEASRIGKPVLLPGLGAAMKASREAVLRDFETEASRYHQKVYTVKKKELADKVDGRLKALFQGQLHAAHKGGVANFSTAVSEAVRLGQKRGSNYDFAKIVETEKSKAVTSFESEATDLLIEGASWSNYKQQLSLFLADLDEGSARLRKEEMRRLATRIERWVKTKLAESVSLEFNKLGTAARGSTSTSPSTDPTEKQPTEQDLWDRIWTSFATTVTHAEKRFTERARGFDASPEEVDLGLWRLRRKAWAALRSKLDEEVMEGNILLKLRENFEDKFRYDAEGVPRIWRPTDDIESQYTAARSSTLQLIPLLARFRLARTGGPPPLEEYVGPTPESAAPLDEEDLQPIGGVDADAPDTTLEDECTLLSDQRTTDLTTRFKKAADGVYVEAKRSAIGGVTQVPLYFYGLLLALGWNEIVAVLRNPVYFIFLILVGVGAYVTWSLNLWGPMIRMGDAAVKQGVEVGKEKLREFLEAQQQAGGAGGGVGGRKREKAVRGRDEESDEDGEI